jgi:hypothetical protein
MNRSIPVHVMAAAAILTLASCSAGERRTASAAAPDTLPNGLPRVLVAKLANWSIAWRHANPRFAPELLVRAGRSPYSFSVYGFGPRAMEDFRTQAKLQELSPDSTRSLEFDMYQDYFREGGGEVDSAPLLADFKSDTLWQPAFCGTPCSFDGAAWVDNDRFALTGLNLTGENADGPPCAFVDIYDLRDGSVTRWVLPVVNEAEYEGYKTASDSILAERFAHARIRS